MRAIYSLFLSILLCTVYAQSGTNTIDTIYRSLSAVQADSLITANSSNPDFTIIDVRTPSEYNGGHLLNATNINYYDANFSSQIAALDHSKPYLLYCAAGSRSTATFNMMQTQHFIEVYNMLGGINGWISAGYPTTTTTGIMAYSLSAVNITTWPNPVSSILNITIHEALPVESVFLTRTDGRIVFSSREIQGSYSIDMSGLPAGMYVLTLISQGQPDSRMILKN